MAKAGFNKKLQPSCEYCIFGERLEFGNEIICKKRGVTEKRDYCRSYKYNPLKREPKLPQISDNYNPEDFKL